MTGKIARLVLSVLMLLPLVLAAAPMGSSEAAPALQGGNLLSGGDFEGAFGGIGTHTSWSPWHQDVLCGEGERPEDLNYACRPDWSPETVTADLIHGGFQSQHIGVHYTPWYAGVFQTVNAPAGARVRLTAWGRAFASNDYYPAPSDSSKNARMQVGIDPNGAGLWYQNVIWSGEINPHGAWQAVSVEATVGDSGKVSVFLSTNYKGSSAFNLDAWWDDAVLEVVGTPSTATPAATQPPTAPPAPVIVSTATPMPDGSIVHTVSAGETLLSIAYLYDTTLDELRALNDIGTFIITGQKLLIRPATAAEEPTIEATEVVEDVTPEPVATETPAGVEPAPAPTSETGTICVVAYDDSNQNGAQDGIEGLISGVTITLFDGQQIVGTQTSNALAGQICFQELKTGPYRVFQTVPPSRQATTSENVAVDLQSGQMVMVLFGSIVAPADQPTAAADSQETTEEPATDTSRGKLIDTILTIGGVLILLVAAALVAVYFVFRGK